MKIYNISDTERFFNALDRCEGPVHVIGRDGSSIPLMENGQDSGLKILKDTYTGGIIGQIELLFGSSQDVNRMVEFLASMNNAA